MFVFVNFGLNDQRSEDPTEFSDVYGPYESEMAALDAARRFYASLGVALPFTKPEGRKTWLCEEDWSKVGYVRRLHLF